jgi:pilus assembly protein Flp/PilA
LNPIFIELTASLYRSRNSPRHRFLGFQRKFGVVTSPLLLFSFGGITTMSKLVSFLKDESGATAIEYGLIAAGISVAIIAVVNGLGTKLNTTFSSISGQLR